MSVCLLAAALAGQLSAAQLHARVAEERGRPVVVSFWATWCEPCRKEFPQLAELAKARSEVAWISVSIDDASDRAAVERIVQQTAPPFPVYLRAPGPDQAFIDGVDPKWSGVVPMTLVFDAAGQRRALITGEREPDKIRRALDDVAAASTPGAKP